MRGLSAAAIGVATVAVLAAPWFLGTGGFGGLGFGAADPSGTAADVSSSPSATSFRRDPHIQHRSPAVTPLAVPAPPAMYPSRV